MTATSPAERLRAFLAVHAGAGTARAIAGRVVALGWSTVDLDRAAAELGTAFAIPAEHFLDAPDSIALGARCRVGHAVFEGGLSVVLLEPATEGRLAASLARANEGPVAVWLAPADFATTTAGRRATDAATSAKRDGPLGPEQLVLDGRIHGPYRLLVDPAGTIRG